MEAMNEQQPAPPMKATIIPVTAFQQNCTLLWCTTTQRGAFVDPGGDLELLRQAAEQHGVTVEKILVTHGHIDHCGLAGIFAQELGVPVEGPHHDDAWLLADLGSSGAAYGIPGQVWEPTRWLEDGDTVTVGHLSLDVIHCPGHTPGHIVFHYAPLNLAIVGDVLFQGSIGRTDFPRGNHADLIRSITQKLWPLGDNTHFVPGHGQMSSFGAERRTNPFVADSVVARG